MEDLVDAVKAITDEVQPIEEALYQTQNRSRQDPLNFPIRLNDKLAGVMQIGMFGVGRPTTQAYAVRDELFGAIDLELDKLDAIWDEKLPAINEMVREKVIPAIQVDD